jgi:hypothetical protein
MKTPTQAEKKRIAAALKAHEKANKKAADKARVLREEALEQENEEAAAVAVMAAKAYVEHNEKLVKAWWQFWK